MKNAYIFLSDETKYGSIQNVTLHDILNKQNVFLLEKTFCWNSKVSRVLRKVVYSTVINNKLKNIPSKIARFIFKNNYALPKLIHRIKNQYDQIIIVFYNSSIRRYYDDKMLHHLKDNKTKMVLFFMDPSTIFASQDALILLEKDPSIFDAIYTVDRTDAEKRKWKYYPTVYSKIMNSSYSDEYRDLYFAGATKGRNNHLLELVKMFNDKSVKYNMDVVYIHNKEEKIEELNDYVNVKPLSKMKEYQEIIKETTKSNTILELIVGDESASFTLRAYEAIAYNKKLLTNNKMIFKFPYYNDRYMCYFEKVEDIDCEWIKKKEKIDYGYDDEYSPINFIKELEQRFNYEQRETCRN